MSVARLSGIDDKKKMSTTSKRSHVELVSPDGCRREVREQLLDRWGHSRPLYWRSHDAETLAFT